MANRRFDQFRYALEHKMTDIYAKVNIGAVGVPTLVPIDSKGVASIVRNGVGLYTVTLSDQYNKLMGVSASFELAAGSPASGASVVVRAEDVDGVKTIQIEFLNGSFAATELANGVALRLHFELKNSRV
jgi:hypothetical protein